MSKMKKTQNKTNFCFQQAEDPAVHLLYIYDDVAAYGDWNWNTWKYEESETSAKYFRDQLAAIPADHTIELHINSNGGSVKEGVTIYNLLKQSGSRVKGIVDGVAYSVAFVILQACDERIMGVGTTALIHEPWVTASGNARELRKMADDLDVLTASNRKIFLERSSLEEQQLMDMMEAETFLTPDDCLQYGLIDKVEDYGHAQNGATVEEMQKRLQEVMQHMKETKSFREQLELMQNGKKPDTKKSTKKPEQKNTLQGFLQGFRKGE
ncbi:MAG: Clp protease ClpP [Blautia massiliensis]|uniref:head maturation protease, ClpP-related n=1 Tax=Blautia massiliensis (ex Durand et al. 2017) TaxID=1737424 RepID=UPI00242F2E45|nr:head maturation protease, ClpP-related [Blautia massiliensis (ex Durand et al. 2017)]MCI7604158.1 Clp protease ClpP [Blautia massiliensis (ex Durand et al. 2017)]